MALDMHLVEERRLVLIKEASGERAGVTGFPSSDHGSDPPEHQQTLLRAILVVIGKSFLSKTMQKYFRS